MPILMDADALAVFMNDVFKQVAKDFAIDHVGETDLTTRLLTHDRHLRPGGTVSGPSIFALADVSAYLMTLARIGPKALAVTTNCSIDFMRKPAANVDLVAKTRLLKLGRLLSVCDVLVYSEGLEDPVARASLTYSIPPK
ncbi:MAG: PaaI family thioesterase [Sulfitobacter sp.]|jgi:uncharacterized protein (TIGR00369 family)|uniref:PaaI family thioesterase n=1 Tax=Sulfitobacter sp. TaxID=1903071 RepID=UPI000C3F1B9B|nr:thioesterase [Roseobacter sp.]MBV47082.1 thioesterase [Roseobacter sp.]|tara:strand:+ start:9835 stop:10254 length:420 start_codon:yes stop_codon:yes gene_type:complete